MRSGRQVFWLVPLAALPLPWFFNEYHQYVANLVLVYVVVGVGFNIVVGHLGQLAFSNVAFFGIGAYAAGILMVKLGLPWWVTVLPAGAMGALAGCVASVPALRGVRLFYLAMMTLAFGELMRWTYIRADFLTGGSMGMAVPPADVLGWMLDTEFEKFYVFLVITVLLVIATGRLLRSRVGRAFLAIKSDEIAAAAMGIPTGRYFVLAFAWSGFVVGIAGAMYAALVGHLTPEAFNLRAADPAFCHHHGRRAGEPDRIDHRRPGHHHHAGDLPRLPGLRGADLRAPDHPRHPVPAARPREPARAAASGVPRPVPSGVTWRRCSGCPMSRCASAA